MDYDQIGLEDIETYNFYADPKAKTFVQSLKQKHRDFDIKIEGLDTRVILTYIALLYDPSSEIRNNIPFYPVRKRIAAKIAGFSLNKDGKFDQIIEDILIGMADSVNAAIIQYCFLSNNIFAISHAVYTDMFFKASADAFKSYEKDTAKIISDLQDKLVSHEQIIFGGEEVMNMRKALYAATKKIELDFIPEAVVRQIELEGDVKPGWSPYPDGYRPNPPKYAGHKIPDDDQ